MAEARSRTQFPAGVQQAAKGVVQAEIEAFEEGVRAGRQYAALAMRKIAAWAEENPGQMLFAGLAGGFLLGKLLYRERRLRLEDLEED